MVYMGELVNSFVATKRPTSPMLDLGAEFEGPSAISSVLGVAAGACQGEVCDWMLGHCWSLHAALQFESFNCMPHVNVINCSGFLLTREHSWHEI